MLTCKNKNIEIKAATDGEKFYYQVIVEDTITQKVIEFYLEEEGLESLISSIATIKEMVAATSN